MNNFKTTKRIIGVILAAAGTLSLSACSFFEGNTYMEPSVPMYTLPRSENEYRESISLITGEDSASLELKKNYYEALREMDVLSETDYRELADTYEKLGLKEEARATYITLQRLFPSKENLEHINSITLDMNDDMIAGLDTIKDALLSLSKMEDYSNISADEAKKIADDVKAAITSEDFKAQYCDELVGVCGKYYYKSPEYVCQVMTDYRTTAITYKYSDFTFLKLNYSEDGLTLFAGKYLNDAYNGKFVLINYDKDNIRQTSYDGTLTNNMLTGKFNVIAYENGEQSMKYSGRFNNDGTTRLTQYDALLEKGELIYALDDNNETYLYIENAGIEYVFACEFVGISKYTQWQ